MNRSLAWCVLLAACGDGGEPVSPDASPVQPGSVSIRVTLANTPQANVEVMFQEADSTVKSVTVTDVDGAASGDIGAGGFVTVVEPRAGSTARDTLSTFTNVQPNDDLHLDLTAPAGDETPVTFMLQVEPDPDVAAVSLQVRTSCGEALGFGVTQPEEVTLLGCGDEADLLVISGDDAGTVLRSQFTRAQRLDQPVVLDNSYVDVLAPTVTYQNLPTNVTFVGVYRAYDTSRGRLFDSSSGAFLDQTTATTAVLLPEIPVATGDRVLTSSAVFPPQGAVGQQTILEWSAATTDRDYTLNVGNAKLDEFATRPTYDPAEHLVSWTEGAGGQAPNFSRASVSIFRDDIPEGRGWSWRIVSAHDGSSLAFPVLPPARDGFDFNVIDGDSAAVSLLTTAKLPAGYGDIATRTHAFDDLKTQITGISGQLIIQDLTDPVPEPQPDL